MPVEHTRMEKTERPIAVKVRGVFVNLRRDYADHWNTVGLVPNINLVHLAGLRRSERTAEKTLASASPPLKARKGLQYEKSLVGWRKAFRREPTRKAHRSLSVWARVPSD